MKKSIFCKLFFILFLFTAISLSAAIPKKKSWCDWFNEPIYVEIPVLEELHENICRTFKIDDLYKWIALLPDDNYKVVARTVGQGLSVQRKIKIISDPLARQLIDPLLDLLRKGYWVRTITKEAITASWQTSSWAKVIMLYGCDLAYTTIAYPNDNVTWRFIKSLLLSDWYMKLYKGLVPVYVQNKKGLDFVVNAYVLATGNYLLSRLKFDKSC